MTWFDIAIAGAAGVALGFFLAYVFIDATDGPDDRFG